MKATEVRIGNLFSNAGLIRPVEPYDLNHWNSIAKEPITLTEEWLEKFGFEKVDHIHGYSFFNLEKLKLRLYENRTEVRGVIVHHCEYVHQLQNLYFALTGEELEIKKPMKTPTPQEQAEMLIEAHKPFSESYTYSPLEIDWREQERINATKAAIVTVETMLVENCKGSEHKSPKYQDERFEYWQEVLTILKGKV